MDVIKSRRACSSADAEAVGQAMRHFSTEYGEYLVLHSSFRTASGTPSRSAAVRH